MLRETKDAYLGLDDPSEREWTEWYDAMLAERSRILREVFPGEHQGYPDDETRWSDRSFRQMFLFMYDAAFYDREARRYRTTELVLRWRKMFGRVDSVLLWHAYPRLGFDERAQFDFYRDMPGGLTALRRDVCDVFHAEGIRVFVDYNPWAEGSYEELAAIVEALDADGVMLDTMTDAPGELASKVLRRRKGVVFAPELRMNDGDMPRHRQSWAQWIEIGDASTPSIPRLRWLAPQHRQLSIRRWDRSRRHEIVYAFFNGLGLILWDNIFGARNPYSPEDRRRIAESGAILDRYEDVFVRGALTPLVPTGISGLDANRWEHEGVVVLTLQNRTGERKRFPSPFDHAVVFWGDARRARRGESVVVEPYGMQAIVVDPDAAHAAAALAHFDQAGVSAAAPQPDYDQVAPPVHVTAQLPTAPHDVDAAPDMIVMPAATTGGATFEMAIRHARRECGCYATGASNDAIWGWFYKDTVEHHIAPPQRPYAIRRTAVTNRDYLAFVHQSSYTPHDPENFLKHIPRTPEGALPTTLHELSDLPVTYVSLADARAFAAYHGQRLPTEAEWQWCAEGAGEGHRHPGGAPPAAPSGRLHAADLATACTTRHGVRGLSGNAWELTESEWFDGHTRFVMLRGGVYLPQGESEWLVDRGARPNDSHAKYILLADGLDRSPAISFRTVMSLDPWEGVSPSGTP